MPTQAGWTDWTENFLTQHSVQTRQYNVHPLPFISCPCGIARPSTWHSLQHECISQHLAMGQRLGGQLFAGSAQHGCVRSAEAASAVSGWGRYSAILPAFNISDKQKRRQRAGQRPPPCAHQDAPEGACACCACADADADAEPLYTLALHSVVLAGASPGHLRAHCLRRTETETSQDTDHVHVHVHIHTSSSVPKHMYEYRLTLLHGEPETVPKAVLCHLYTGALPDDPEQLIWVSKVEH